MVLVSEDTVYRTRSRRNSSGFHDSVGWLYADIFLALMIVGVGSSVVVRQVVPSVSASPSPATGMSTRLSCNEFAVSIPALVADASDDVVLGHVTQQLNDEIARRGLTSDTATPALVLVMGGFELYENAGDGEVNARTMRSRLRKIVPPFLDVEMRTGGSRSAVVDGVRTTVGNNGDYLLVVYLLQTQSEVQSCQ